MNITDYISQIKADKLNSFIRIHDKFISENYESLLDKPFSATPIGIKDNMMLKGEITSCASKMLENYIAPYTATCVQRLINAGFLPIGKTNMDEFAMGSSTEHSYFGVSKNPHGIDRIPGGSSGGSAVAVASGLVKYALGTDTGGSIRQPAALCGIVGFKPTYGKISRYGVQSLSSSLDQVGTLTQTVADTKILLEIMSGPDENDLQTLKPKVEKADLIERKNSTTRLAVPNQIFTSALDSRVETLFHQKLENLKSQGVSIDFIDFPLLKYAGALYYILMSAELTSNLGRFDGIRFGYQSKNLNYIQTRSQAFGKEVKKRLMLGNYVVLHENYDKYYKPALDAKNELSSQFSKLFETYEAIITPTTPTPASKIGSKTTNSLQMYLEDLYTTPANLAGLPAISVPMGFINEGEEKLPVGLQLIGKQRGDEDLLNLTETIQ